MTEDVDEALQALQLELRQLLRIVDDAGWVAHTQKVSPALSPKEREAAKRLQSSLTDAGNYALDLARSLERRRGRQRR